MAAQDLFDGSPAWAVMTSTVRAEVSTVPSGGRVGLGDSRADEAVLRVSCGGASVPRALMREIGDEKPPRPLAGHERRGCVCVVRNQPFHPYDSCAEVA